MPHVESAVACMNAGYSCSQAILSTYGPQFGLDRELALKLASGFAGGMRMGETCGAVAAALMVLGLKLGHSDPSDAEAKARTYALMAEFIDRFKAQHGSVICKQLLHCDISAPEGLAAAREQGLFQTICPKMVQSAAEILEQMP